MPLLTTLSAAAAASSAIRGLRERPLTVRSLQAHYAATNPALARAAWWGTPPGGPAPPVETAVPDRAHPAQTRA